MKMVPVKHDSENYNHIEDLKLELESLRKKMAQPSSTEHELLLEIESLKDSLHELNAIFTKALNEMKGEENVAKLLHVLQEKVEAVVSQNETIARGMVAVSDKVDDFVNKASAGIQRTMPQMPQHIMGSPQMTGPRMAPPPAETFSGSLDVPPPPPGGKRKPIF